MNEHIELFMEFKKYIKKMEVAIRNTYDKFQSGNYVEGIEILPDIIQGLEWSIDAAYSIKDYIDYKINVEDFNRKLRELLDGIKNEDTILIGDVLEYEIYPIILEWENIVLN